MDFVIERHLIEQRIANRAIRLMETRYAWNSIGAILEAVGKLTPDRQAELEVLINAEAANAASKLLSASWEYWMEFAMDTAELEIGNEISAEDEITNLEEVWES